MATDRGPAPRTSAQQPHDPSRQPGDPALRARRASSFGAEAAAYAEHRPDYPRDGVNWALAPVLSAPGPTAGTALDILDLGAGTGKLTAVLTGLGHRVTAVEPDPAMLGELRVRVPEVRALPGGAEDIPLPDASVDAVLVGQAFHWFDQEKALPEIARVLRPGGVLAALWNSDDDRVGWIAELGRISSSRVSFVEWPTTHGITAHPAFSPVESTHVPHFQQRTAESLVANVATHSSILLLEPRERDEVLDRVREFLASRADTASGSFDFPMVTRVERCVRVAD
ncbi:class I SAM-dependent methyltransferase [Actinacidiphila acidipaludis]|uniref:Methyltransferase domain-containing protein n=1 Tax=Actinacidiphila acidipaludis TaxID=2873382 RepID=A0ABS7QCC2_9ACTN|nr:class I SAM-dependent methyltransferase [Streptomyces acidipaludis]MBY8880324.1 methyltransferase domain-containing protein [Streptomyces acidipaludis]